MYEAYKSNTFMRAFFMCQVLLQQTVAINTELMVYCPKFLDCSSVKPQVPNLQKHIDCFID